RGTGDDQPVTLPLAWDARRIEGEWEDALETVFDGGKLLVDVSLDEVRARAEAYED
ncbi:MAG: nicotinate phosphoribosyltransferase, partial [Pseudomonadota bacterium]